MESRVSIDLDYDNQPIIRIDYKPSEDVRDKIVKRFLEGFGSESCFATFRYSNSALDQNNTLGVIRPIAPSHLSISIQEMQEIVSRRDLLPENQEG